MTTQDQLENALQIADFAMKASALNPNDPQWVEQLKALAHQLARVAGLVNNESTQRDFVESIVEAIKRRRDMAT